MKENIQEVKVLKLGHISSSVRYTAFNTLSTLNYFFFMQEWVSGKEDS